jgi:hypothetical protein
MQYFWMLYKFHLDLRNAPSKSTLYICPEQQITKPTGLFFSFGARWASEITLNKSYLLIV